MSYQSALRKAKAAIQKWARMRDSDENGIIRTGLNNNSKKELIMVTKKAGLKKVKKVKAVVDLLGSIGDISKFSLLSDGWVRWSLINRDFGPEPKECMPWDKAKEHVAGIKDARLGSRLEHFLLFCAFEANPEIKKKFFPNAKDGWYWTEEEYGSLSAWVVGFSDGIVVSFTKGYHHFVRPCRASQCLII